MKHRWGVAVALLFAVLLHIMLGWVFMSLTVPIPPQTVQLLSLEWIEDAPRAPVSPAPTIPRVAAVPSAPVPVLTTHVAPSMPVLKAPPHPKHTPVNKPTAVPPVPVSAVATESVAPPPSPVLSSEPQVAMVRAEADYLHNPKPSYPRLAKRMGEQGEVRLRVEVGADGSVIQLQLVQSSGFERLDDAAQQAVKQWQFKPAMQGSQAVRSWVEIPVKFVLEDHE